MYDIFFVRKHASCQILLLQFFFFLKLQIKYQLLLFAFYGVEDRQKGRFAGFSLYVSNTGVIEGSTLCYKDGPQLPSLNFTTTCTEYGRYVIFLNERKDGVVYPDGYQLTNVYTELCEVIIKGILYMLYDRAFPGWLLFTITMEISLCGVFLF